MTRVDAEGRWHPALAGVSLILLDFDGPVVRLLPDPEHLQLAEDMARWCADRTGQVPAVPAVDHVTVLRYILEHHREWATAAERMATTSELAAAAARDAYPHAIDMMRRWLDDGGRLAVVSNNAEQAVREVLARSALGDWGGTNAYTIHARRSTGIGRLKPRPDLLLQAMDTHGVAATRTVMVGDTVGDVRAGQAAGVPTIGVAESADRAAALRRTGAVTVVTGLGDLQTNAGAAWQAPGVPPIMRP